MRSALLGSVAVALLAMPAAALAQDGIPPGSAGDQYIEGVPAPGGEKPSTGGGSGGSDDGSGQGGDPGAVLSPDAQDALEAEGALGQQVGAVAAATAPDSQGGAGNAARSEGGGSEQSGSRLEEIFTAITGSSSDGMGFVLPAIIGASLIAALILLLARRRRGTAETS